MKKDYRRSINLTSEQVEILEYFSKYSGSSLSETIRAFIDKASNNLVREITISTKNGDFRRIILKDANVTYFKRFNDTGDMGDWVSTFELGLTVNEVVNLLIDARNCEYKKYIVSFKDDEVCVDDIVTVGIETMDGRIVCY